MGREGDHEMTDLSLRIREIIAEIIPGCPMAPEEMTAATRLRDELKADSLDEVEIAMALEAAFHINIPDQTIDEITTVGDLIVCVEARRVLSAGESA